MNERLCKRAFGCEDKVWIVSKAEELLDTIKSHFEFTDDSYPSFILVEDVEAMIADIISYPNDHIFADTTFGNFAKVIHRSYSEYLESKRSAVNSHLEFVYHGNNK